MGGAAQPCHACTHGFFSTSAGRAATGAEGLQLEKFTRIVHNTPPTTREYFSTSTMDFRKLQLVQVPKGALRLGSIKLIEQENGDVVLLPWQ